MNAAYVYLQLYKLFDKVTPLKFDCGMLCNGACCEGDDSGMYLFPGEKKVYELLNCSWADIEMSEFKYEHDGRIKKTPILFCGGKCDRYQRPLACRIFPLTPYLENGKLKIIVDPRAKSVCPLSYADDINEFEPDFIKNVEKVFRALLSNREFYSFMNAYSEYIDEYLKFYK